MKESKKFKRQNAVRKQKIRKVWDPEGLVEEQKNQELFNQELGLAELFNEEEDKKDPGWERFTADKIKEIERAGMSDEDRKEAEERDRIRRICNDPTHKDYSKCKRKRGFLSSEEKELER